LLQNKKMSKIKLKRNMSMAQMSKALVPEETMTQVALTLMISEALVSEGRNKEFLKSGILTKFVKIFDWYDDMFPNWPPANAQYTKPPHRMVCNLLSALSRVCNKDLEAQEQVGISGCVPHLVKFLQPVPPPTTEPSMQANPGVADPVEMTACATATVAHCCSKNAQNRDRLMNCIEFKHLMKLWESCTYVPKGDVVRGVLLVSSRSLVAALLKARHPSMTAEEIRHAADVISQDPVASH